MNSWQQKEAALATLAKEVGYIRKPHTDRLRVALAFPNTYWVGMSNLGFQTVYQLFNAHDDTVCERLFLPPKQQLKEQLASKTPLMTLESQSLARDFDVIAFSVSFEWDYTNILTMLRLAGLQVRSANRTARDPLVVIGGAVTFVNPEPLAMFADVIAAGEGEELVPALLSSFREDGGRRDLLKSLAKKRGFYIPSFYDVDIQAGWHDRSFRAQGSHRRTARRCAKLPCPRQRRSIRPAPGFSRPTQSSGRASSSKSSAAAPISAASAGPATTTCRFGLFRPTAFLSGRARRARTQSTPASCRLRSATIPRSTASSAGSPGMGYSISPASLRLDDLTETIVGQLRASGEKTLTIAPETGSDRLRRVINKTVTNDEILDRAELIFSSGIENLKLYYMIGLPTETDDDLVAIRDLTLQIRDIMLKHAKGRGHIGRVIASVNPLVPKPSTAYQWLPMEDAVGDR